MDEVARARHLLGQLEVAQRLGIWEWHPASDKMIWSDGLYELLGVAPEIPASMAGMIATVHPADRARFESHLARARRERGLLAFRCQAIGGTGEPRVLQVRMQRTLDADGALRSVVGTSQDITEDAAASDPQAAMVALTGALAHQINNPLAVISSFLQMLPADTAGEALDAVTRITDLVADLRLYARGDAARSTVELERAIDTALARVRNPGARTTIVTRFEATPPVLANPASLVRVVRELVDNALEAVAGATVREVHVTTRREGAWSVFEVSDSGGGIPPALHARVFEPFFTTKGPARRGLGLSVCRGIVHALGGSITINHDRTGPGQGALGARVVVALPAAASAVPEVRAVTPARAVASPGRGRVLVVDDEVLFVTAMTRLLSHEHDVSSAANGRVALELIRGGERYDAILCDLTMPELTGAELHAALAELAPDQAARMVFVTGGALDRASEEFLATVEFFEKPCDVQMLRDAVRRQVERSDAAS